MNYFSEAEKFANEKFSNYDGDSWENFDDGYDFADGGQMPVAEALPFVINIQNTTTTDVSNVVFLNANLAGNATAPAFGNNAAIVITMDGTISYAEFLQNIKSAPFKVGQIYLESANAAQPWKTLTITNKQANGVTQNIPITPRKDPMQNQSDVSIVKTEFTVNAFTSIATTILASATLTVSLYPKEELAVARALDGKNVAKTYSRPNLSQMQRLR